MLIDGHEVVGLIPAAGQAKRLGRLPCSKEVLPVAPAGGVDRPRVAAEALVEDLGRAGVRRAFMVLRHGKWDVPAYLGNGRRYGLDLAYLLAEDSQGVPDTLEAARSFVADHVVVLGFPDILYRPANAIGPLLERLRSSSADLVLGTFAADEPERSDVVETDGRGRVVAVQVKPETPETRESWILAAWRPTFTSFLSEFTAGARHGARELHLGHAFAAAAGSLRVEALPFAHGSFLDIGTPEAWRVALRGWPDPQPGGTQ